MNGYIYNFYICVCEHSLQLHFIIFPHKHRKKLAICGNETEKSGSNPYSKVMRNTEYTIHKTLHAVCFCMRSLSFLHIFGSKYSLLCKWDKNATQTIFSLRNLIVNFFFFCSVRNSHRAQFVWVHLFCTEAIATVAQHQIFYCWLLPFKIMLRTTENTFGSMVLCFFLCFSFFFFSLPGKVWKNRFGNFTLPLCIHKNTQK